MVESGQPHNIVCSRQRGAGSLGSFSAFSKSVFVRNVKCPEGPLRLKLVLGKAGTFRETVILCEVNGFRTWRPDWKHSDYCNSTWYINGRHDHDS